MIHRNIGPDGARKYTLGLISQPRDTETTPNGDVSTEATREREREKVGRRNQVISPVDHKLCIFCVSRLRLKGEVTYTPTLPSSAFIFRESCCCCHVLVCSLLGCRPTSWKKKTSDKRPQRNARHFVCQVRNRQPWNKLTSLIPKTFVLFVPAGKLRGGLFRNEEIVCGLKYLEASNCRVAGPGIGQLEFGAKGIALLWPKREAVHSTANARWD